MGLFWVVGRGGVVGKRGFGEWGFGGGRVLWENWGWEGVWVGNGRFEG